MLCLYSWYVNKHYGDSSQAGAFWHRLHAIFQFSLISILVVQWIRKVLWSRPRTKWKAKSAKVSMKPIFNHQGHIMLLTVSSVASPSMFRCTIEWFGGIIKTFVLDHAILLYRQELHPILRFFLRIT